MSAATGTRDDAPTAPAPAAAPAPSGIRFDHVSVAYGGTSSWTTSS